MKVDITRRHGNLSRKIRGSILLFFLGVAATIPAAWALSGEPKTGLSITAQELRALPANEVVIIDTRSKWKYFLGHIPGSVNLPDWQDFTRVRDGVRGILVEDPRVIADKLRPLGIDTQKTIVLYGDPRDPWRTDGRFFWMFERFGFGSVSILQGGLNYWEKHGGPVARGIGKPAVQSTLSAKEIRLNPGVAADPSWIRERLQSGQIAIIDNRTRKEYDGATPYGSKRGGHIPHAVHIHWPEFFTEEGIVKDEQVVTSLLEKHGIRRDREIVVYCTGGVRSAMAYFVLRTLGYSVRNYDGSWWDWSRNPDLPIELS